MPEVWDKDSQRVKGLSDETGLANYKPQEIYSKLIKIEKQLYDEGETITLEAIYTRYKGKDNDENQTLCGVFNERISKMKAFPKT